MAENVEVEYKLHLHEAAAMSFMSSPGIAIKQGYFDLDMVEMKLTSYREPELLFRFHKSAVLIYLNKEELASVKKAFESEDSLSARVRRTTHPDGRKSYEVTLKSKMKSGDGSKPTARLEVDIRINGKDGEKLLEFTKSSTIEKMRYVIPIDAEGLKWEVDVFFGKNRGLVIAEVEVPNIDTSMPLPHPSWIYTDITNNGKMTNKSLSFHPVIYFEKFDDCKLTC